MAFLGTPFTVGVLGRQYTNDSRTSLLRRTSNPEKSRLMLQNRNVVKNQLRVEKLSDTYHNLPQIRSITTENTPNRLSVSFQTKTPASGRCSTVWYTEDYPGSGRLTIVMSGLEETLC